MKNWQQKIREGMNLIIEGCKENTEWCACHDCPFAELCDIIHQVLTQLPIAMRKKDCLTKSKVNITLLFCPGVLVKILTIFFFKNCLTLAPLCAIL
jgi:hypothetical protein